MSDNRQHVTPSGTPSSLSVVVVIDMVGYSSLARMLEENSGAAAVAQLNRQIQGFVRVGLDALPTDAVFTAVADTGDGAIILLNTAEDAHTVATHLLANADEHNQGRTDESAKRWFRIGIASGEVTRKNLDDEEGGYAGIAIANAVRLESAARGGEIVIDAATFEALPEETRGLYGAESTIRGKRTEVFRVRRYRVASAVRISARWSSTRNILAGRRLWPSMLAISLVCLLVAGVYLPFHRAGAQPFQTFKIQQITNTGHYAAAAVSPDGRYLLSAVQENGRQSLWLRNLPTNSNTRILAPADAAYDSLSFSFDGNYIYFRQSVSSDSQESGLYRAPVLGGPLQPVVRGAESGATFSPDGKRIAFIHLDAPASKTLSLFTSNLDGTDRRVVATLAQSFYSSFVAWAPDNRHIALALAGTNQGDYTVQVHDLASSKVRVLAAFTDLPLDSISWVPNGSGLVITYENNIGYVTRKQVGFLSNADGDFRRITNDTDDYGPITVSADGKTVSTVQLRTAYTLYRLPREGFTGQTPAPAPAQSRDAAMFGWAKDGSVYFGATGSLLNVSADGARTTAPISDPSSSFIHPSACGDGRFIAFTWSNHDGNRKTNIWRVAADGSDLKQLTFGSGDINPVCSPDGKRVYFQTVSPLRVFRVDIDGGTPAEVPGTAGLVNRARFKLSSDGRSMVLFRGGTDPAARHGQIALVPLDAGDQPQVKIFEADPRLSRLVSLTPDGSAFVYVLRENGTDNLWKQPLDGSPRRPMTSFTSDTIEFFEFTPDGTAIGVTRMHRESDVVLLHDTAAQDW